MSRHTLAYLVASLAVSSLGGVVRAEPPPPAASPDAAALRSADDQERAAVLKRDREALSRLWSDRFTVNAPVNRVVEGKDAVLALLDLGVIHYSAFERAVELVRVDGDLGIVMGKETVKPIGKAPLAGQTLERRFTNLWRKESGTWRLYARHANIVPPTPPAP